MTAFGRLLVIGLTVALAGCSDVRKDTARTLRQIGAPTLRSDAAAFYKNLFAAPSGGYILVSPGKCPPTFQRFAPTEVRAYTDGFALALRAEHGAEEGLYVVPAGMDHDPRTAPNTRFERIDDGIFWYRFAR